MNFSTLDRFLKTKIGIFREKLINVSGKIFTSDTLPVHRLCRCRVWCQCAASCVLSTCHSSQNFSCKLHRNRPENMFPFIESNNKHKNLLFTFFLVSQHFSYFPHRSAISIKSTSTSDSKPGFSLLAPQTSFLAQVCSCHQVNNLLAYQFHI